MKKVLFTATVDSHILHFHLPYLKLFKDNGYEVHVATNGDEVIPYCDVKHKVTFERSPYKVNNLKAIKQLRKIIDNEKFDIIHCHTPMGSVVTRIAAKRARKKGTRVIYTAHGFHFYKGAPLMNWLLFYPVEKYLSRYTDTLITINNEDYELAKKKFKKTTVQYIPGVGIDPNKFDIKITEKEKDSLRIELGLRKDDFVIIYPAELSDRKRQIWLINSIKSLLYKNPDIHLLLPGKDSLNGMCHELVRQLNLDKQVHLLGYRKDVPKLLRISNLAVSSSKQEGLPVNLLEAMYVGIPIVASDCRGNRDLLDNGKNGYLIDIDDSVLFCQTINKVYKNVNRCRNKFEKENKRIIKDFMLDKIVMDMKNIYFQKVEGIAYLRSTEIYNDSRATKEIRSYSEILEKVLVIGWNRNNVSYDKVKTNLPQNCNLCLYDKKAPYGSGIKNILNIIKFNVFIYKSLKENRTNFEVIHACDFDTALIANIFAKKYRKKLIYDIYDYYCDCHSLGIMKKYVEKIDIGVINSADAVIICTEKRKLQIKKANPTDIYVIHNSPYVSTIDFSSEKRKPARKNRPIKIGYFGILQDDRLLIEIAEKVKGDNRYEFIIGGFGKYESYFENLSSQYKNVKYVGSLKYEDVIKNEENCDILFAVYNPSIKNHRFSAPNKVYEAMSLGKPIIVCNNTGIDDLVRSEETGYVIDYSVEEFFKVLNNLKPINSKRIKKIFEEKYSWNIMDKKIKQIISKLEN